MQRTPDLPPLRGGIKGGVHPVSAIRSVGHLHRRSGICVLGIVISWNGHKKLRRCDGERSGDGADRL